MDVDKAFESIRDNIKNENYKAVRPEIDSIVASNPNDVDIILKCASLLKTIDDEGGCQSLVDDALEALPSDGSKDFDVALAVRGLGRPEEAYRLMKKFKDDQALFDQQIEILKDGFDKLNADRKKIEREWKKLEQERGFLREDEYSRAEFFFQGVNSLLALKKRYRDLMKIYHPDNMCGDHRVCDMINEEYNILLRQFDSYMKA